MNPGLPEENQERLSRGLNDHSYPMLLLPLLIPLPIHVMIFLVIMAMVFILKVIAINVFVNVMMDTKTRFAVLKDWFLILLDGYCLKS